MNVTLRAGTRYNLVLQDGTLGPDSTLPLDIEVSVGALSEGGNMYVHTDPDGDETMLFVQPQNEVR